MTFDEWWRTQAHLYNQDQESVARAASVWALRETADEIERQKGVIGSVNARCDHLGMRLGEVIRERDKLRAAIQQTLDENGDLADGDDCTLAVLKRALETPNVEGNRPPRMNGGQE